MAAPKKEKFDKKLTETADVAKVLSHPARLEILNALAEKNMCICGEIVEIVPLSQSTVSQHIKELKEIGLVKGTIDGVKSCYCIDWKTLEEKIKLLTEYITKLKNQKTKCC
ncbi:MAG: winged helix-turn-helix transcriptional regulator [Ignavibacteria bacterium]|nr:winged helix-turn-helix transcriptional regulator [Ignavibacteria bacterium]